MKFPAQSKQTNFKMYKKGKIWLFSAAIMFTGALVTTTNASADESTEPVATENVTSAVPDSGNSVTLPTSVNTPVSDSTGVTSST